MKSPEYDMRRSAVQVITVLTGLLITVTGTIVYLVNNEFEAEHQLNEMRVKLNGFQQDNKNVANKLPSKNDELIHCSDRVRFLRSLNFRLLN